MTPNRTLLRLLLLSLFCMAFAESRAVNAQVSGINSVSGAPLYIGASGNIYMNVDTTGNIGVGIGTASPSALFDVGGSGLFHVAGNVGGAATAVLGAQGAYLGWNFLSGGTGETDFINQQGLGTGGFAFFDSSGTTKGTPLLVISGSSSSLSCTGCVGIGLGTAQPQATLDIFDKLIIQRNSGATLSSPRIYFIDLSQGTETAAPDWAIDNLNDQFRIFRKINLATPGTVYLSINNSGEAGVGTTTPAGTLDIENASGTATLCLNGQCTSTLGGGGSGAATYGGSFMPSCFGQVRGNPFTGGLTCPSWASVQRAGQYTVVYGSGVWNGCPTTDCWSQ